MQQRLAASPSLLLSLLFVSLWLAGCSAIKAPARPDYTGIDSVNTATTTQLVGLWRVTNLNPYPGNESQTTTIEYRKDGTVKGLLTLQDDGTDALGQMEFELTGNWMLERDIVSHENITMRSTIDNPMADIVSDIINSRPAISSKANIYELSDVRMVMVGTDGNAMEYVKQ